MQIKAWNLEIRIRKLVWKSSRFKNSWKAKPSASNSKVKRYTLYNTLHFVLKLKTYNLINQNVGIVMRSSEIQ